MRRAGRPPCRTSCGRSSTPKSSCSTIEVTMLTIKGRKLLWNDGSSRRDFLTCGAASLIGLTLADWFRMKAAGLTQEAKAKSVIQLLMAGGPTQTDTFDPKPQ